MRILVHGINFPPELIGVAKFTGEMCEWLARRGHAFKIISSYPHYPDWKITEAGGHRSYSFDSISGLSVMRCPIYVPRHPTGSRRLLHHVSFLASSGPVLVPIARRFRPDVVLAIAPSLIGAPAAALAARMCGAAAWLHIQDFETDAAFELGLLSGARRRRLARNLEAWIMRRFDRLSSISSKMVERLQQRVGPPHQAVEFRNWVDVDLVAPQDRRTAYRPMLGISEDDIVALYAGNMAVKQGLEYVVEAARHLSARARNIVFVLAGAGSKQREIASGAEGLGNVRFLGLQPAERLTELLGTADIHLLPQRAAAADLMLPSKLGGILASGRPVIAMADTGTQLAEEIGNAGLTVPPGNSRAFAEAIHRLGENPELRGAMGVAARTAAVTRWEKATILRQFEAQLFALVAERAARRPLPAGVMSTTSDHE